MPRGPRLDAPGAVHHVMLRGIERRRIFRDADDYEAFARRLDRLVPELGFRCFAWALMPNHVHLALQTRRIPLARLMARLGTGYARYFNRRHRRVGHVFQNRYKSRLVESERDLQGLIVYIHRNPLEAGLARDLAALAHFPWSGHGALVGARAPRCFENPESALEFFGEGNPAALRNLISRMGPSDQTLEAPPLQSQRVLEREEPSKEPPPPTLDVLIDSVCRTHDIPRRLLARGTRNRRIVRARTEIVHRAVQGLGLPSRLLAKTLGVSNSTISRALSRSIDT